MTIDFSLWQDFKNGSERAFALIYANHLQSLYSYCRRFTGETEVIEDCIQDLFIELWHKKENLADIESIQGYLFKCIRRKLLLELKSGRVNQPALLEVFDFNIQISVEEELVESQSLAEKSMRIKKSLQKLTNRQKEVVHLFYFDEMTYEDIASIMGLEKRTVYNTLHNALKTLRIDFVKSKSFYTFLLLL